MHVCIHHASFLERLDARERACNVVITGVPEENWMDTDDDAKKIRLIFDAIGCTSEKDYTWKRIGKPSNPNQPRSQPRPTLIGLESPEARNSVANKASKLNKAGEEFKGVRIKKDQHPAIRKEWWRLFKAEETEKAKPENRGHDVHLDREKRQLLRDGKVIDAFFPIF